MPALLDLDARTRSLPRRRFTALRPRDRCGHPRIVDGAFGHEPLDRCVDRVAA